MGKWVEVGKNGVVETNSFDEESGLLTVAKEEDVEPLLDRNKELQNTGATNVGIKKGLWHYASIPVTVQYELLAKYKLSVHNKHHMPQILEIINRDYKYLKTTTKTHSLTPKRVSSKATTEKPGPFVIVH